MWHVIFTQDSGEYRKGRRVEDQAEVEAILAGERAAHVVKVVAPDPAPDAQPQAQDPAAAAPAAPTPAKPAAPAPTPAPKPAP